MVRERLTVRSVYFVLLCVHASVSLCITLCKPNLPGVLHHCLSTNVFVMVVTHNFIIECCLLGLIFTVARMVLPTYKHKKDILILIIKFSCATFKWILLRVKAVCLNFIKQC